MTTTASPTPAGLLRWLVEAPPLLSCPSPCRDAGELLKREYQLDPDLPERAAVLLQAHTPARRLGLMFEQWVSALVDASNNLERVASNLPFRYQGRTLGELDLLVRDHLEGKLIIDYASTVEKFQLRAQLEELEKRYRFRQLSSQRG